MATVEWRAMFGEALKDAAWMRLGVATSYVYYPCAD